MNTKPLTKARSRLRVATKALSDIETSTDHEVFTDAWFTFLVAAKGVYTTLEQAAKGSPQDVQWMGGKKQERRDDPLLQYLFQARDDDVHGIEMGHEAVASQTLIGANEPGYSTNMTFHDMVFDGEGNVSIGKVETHDGKPLLVKHTPEHIRLIAVTGRGGVTFAPPQEHKGSPLPNASPLGVAKLGLEHLSALVDEAESRA